MTDSVHGPFPAQAHIGWNAQYGNLEDPETMKWERESSHTKQVPPPGQRGYPDVYVNGEDVTVTVDPYKNKQWIRDDSHAWRAAATAHRGALKDHASVVRAAGRLDHHPGPATTFIPTAHMLDGYPVHGRFLTPMCVHNSTRGRRGAPASDTYGELPVINKRIWNNQLRDVVDWDVEAQQWLENTHLSRDRRFDCTGPCR